MADRRKPTLWAVPEAELIKPKNNLIVFADRWWVMHDEGALFWGIPGRHGSPQCNTNRLVTDHSAEAYGRGCRSSFLSLAFVPFTVSSEGFDYLIPEGAVEIGGISE